MFTFTIFRSLICVKKNKEIFVQRYVKKVFFLSDKFNDMNIGSKEFKVNKVKPQLIE